MVTGKLTFARSDTDSARHFQNTFAKRGSLAGQLGPGVALGSSGAVVHGHSITEDGEKYLNEIWLSDRRLSRTTLAVECRTLADRHEDKLA